MRADSGASTLVLVEYWKTKREAIVREFAGLGYQFFRADVRNLLCVPDRRWDRTRYIFRLSGSK
jgi:hypothetical protein